MTELQIRKVRLPRCLPVDERPITIGRAAGNTVVLDADEVSRRHCVIERSNGATRIRDLGSRHGVRINGEKVTEAEVREGDRIRIGCYEIEVFDPDRPASPGDVASAESWTPATEEAEIQRLRDELSALQREHDQRNQAAEQERAGLVETLEAQRERNETLGRELTQLRTTLVVRATALGREVDDLHRRHFDRSREHARLQDELDRALEQAAAERDRAATLTGELDDTRRALETQTDTTQSLEGVVTGLRADLEPAAEFMSRCAAEVRALQEAWQKLSMVRRTIEAVESLWIETDAQAREAAESEGSQAAREFLNQRADVEDKFEDLHTAQDAALAAVRETVMRLGELRLRQANAMPTRPQDTDGKLGNPVSWFCDKAMGLLNATER